MTKALEGNEWSAARPGRTLPPGKARYPLYRRLGGPQGRSGWAETLAPLGCNPRTIQPIASRYTDRAIPAHLLNSWSRNYQKTKWRITVFCTTEKDLWNSARNYISFVYLFIFFPMLRQMLKVKNICKWYKSPFFFSLNQWITLHVHPMPGTVLNMKLSPLYR